MLKPLSNPPNPFARYSYEWLDVPPEANLKIYEEDARSIISENDSPDISFRYSINPYRGCFHACAYCYARPTHQYLDFGAGTDFERKLVAKVNAPQKLRVEFERTSWTGAPLVFSGVTDCYQPLEGSYELTRGCLEICRLYRNPVSIITKGALVERDAELLAELHARASAHVFISVAFADDHLAKLIEPSAPRPSRRFRTMAALAAAGVPVGFSLSPVIPGLNDEQIPEIVRRAAESGATSAFSTLLRLPGPVEEVFFTRLRAAVPERAKKVESFLRETRGGDLNVSRFGSRMRGEGERWAAIRWMFRESCRRHGIACEEFTRSVSGKDEEASTFARPREQLSFPGMR